MIQLTIIIGLLFGASKSDNEIPGTYVRRIQKHSDIRQFGRTLILNCDSSAIATFQGDMMNEKVNGRWKVNGDTLIVTIDGPVGHWRKENLFLIQKKRLVNIVTEINGEKINDKRLLESMYNEAEKYPYDKTEKRDCN